MLIELQVIIDQNMNILYNIKYLCSFLQKSAAQILNHYVTSPFEG